MKKLTVLCMLGLIALTVASTDSIAAPREDTAQKCSDGKDNDRDGLIDAADPDCEDVGGGGGGTGGNVPQKIGVHQDPSLGLPADLWQPTDLLMDCVMQKNSGNSLSGSFPRHDPCATLKTDIGAMVADALRDDIIVVVTTNKQGQVLGVQVQGQDFIGADGIVHISEVMTPTSVVNNPDGTMVIHVHADDVNLLKCDTHVLKRKSVCDIPAGVFSLQDLVYSPDP